MNRRGFTLVELLVALMLGALVVSTVYLTIVRTQRNSQTMAMRIEVQQNLRSGIQYVNAAIRELDAAGLDLPTIQATTIQFRGARWAGALCDDPVPGIAGITLALDRAPYFGVRLPNNTDSVMIFSDGDPTTRSDDGWLFAGVRVVGNGLCADGSAATALIVQANASSGGNAAVTSTVTSGAPLRGFQMEELSLAQQDGRWWLAQRVAPRAGGFGAMQPLVGPLSTGGLQFAFYDTNGNITANPVTVASVQMMLRAESPDRAWTSAGVVDYIRDSLVTRVALRNNARF